MARTTAARSTSMQEKDVGAISMDDAREMMITGLKNAHGLEQQAIEMLERNVERLENYPELRARMSEHLQESRQQQDMIARCLDEMGESPSSVKDTIMGMVQNVQSMMHGAAHDEVLKNSMAGYAFEHFEIASYMALREMAECAGEPKVQQIAEEILQQEQEMADWLEQNLPLVVRQHLALMGTGDEKR